MSAVYIIICYQDYRVSYNRDALINFAEVISYRFVIVFQLQGHDIDGLSDTYISNQGGREDWTLNEHAISIVGLKTFPAIILIIFD